MRGDAAAARVLDEVVEQWTGAGVLGELCDRAQRAWRANLDRHDEDDDDALVLGIRSSRNLAHQTVRALAGASGISAELVGGRSLRVRHAGRTLGVSKAPSGSPTWSPHAMDWSTSEVRQAAAETNAAAYAGTEGALFTLRGADDPQLLSEIHLVWLGLAEGGTRSWVGFPRTGDAPWFAVADLGTRGHVGASVPASPATASSAPARFDELAEAETPMGLRRKPATAQGQDEGSTS